MTGQSYLPKSPLSALSAVAVLAGFGCDFMSNHAVGRATVAVPVAWVDAVVPGGRIVYQTIRSRNRSGAGKPDRSGQSAVESILYLVSLTAQTLAKSVQQCSSPLDAKLLSVWLALQAEAFWQSVPFLLKRYGLKWWALQLPGVRGILSTEQYRAFDQEVG